MAVFRRWCRLDGVASAFGKMGHDFVAIMAIAMGLNSKEVRDAG
jgi:hypothetical protein